MFENRSVFNVLDPETDEDGNRFHLAGIVGLLSLPSSSSSEASAAPSALMTEVST